MNRRQKRAIARRIPGYKGLLKEAAEKSIKEFEEMLQKKWIAETQVLNGEEPTNAASLNESIEKEDKNKEKNLPNEAENTRKNNDGTN